MRTKEKMEWKKNTLRLNESEAKILNSPDRNKTIQLTSIFFYITTIDLVQYDSESEKNRPVCPSNCVQTMREGHAPIEFSHIEFFSHQ